MPKRSRGNRSASISNDEAIDRVHRRKNRKSSDADKGDSVLVSMVTTWVNEADAADDEAKEQPKSKRPKKASPRDGGPDRTTSPPEPKEVVYSVHVTQIAYNATDMEVRSHFASKGIIISSLRMVYDKGIDGRRQFRGVAFLDLADEKSYELSLALNKSVFMGRKINVRPTKSKEELTNIVEATSRKVAEKIRKYNDEKNAAGGDKARERASKNFSAAARRVERKKNRNAKNSPQR